MLRFDAHVRGIRRRVGVEKCILTVTTACFQELDDVGNAMHK